MLGLTSFFRRKLAARPVYLMSVGAALSLLGVWSIFSSQVILPEGQDDSYVLPAELANELDEFTVRPEALIETAGSNAEELNAEIPVVTSSAGMPQPFKSIANGTPNHQTALHCLTEAIYYEAANESVAGKRAVAQTILNRVAHFAYPSSVCGVVYQGWNEPVCQFSYTCDGSLARRPLPRLWEESRKVAQAALDGHVEHRVGTATHYHADYVLPYWAFRLDKVYVEGRHIFYRFKGRAGHAASLNARWNGHEFYPSAAARQLATAGDQQFENGLSSANLAQLERAPTERRADNDIGGRLNPASGWKLSIPDPVDASRGFQAALQHQHSNDASAILKTDVVHSLP